VENESAIYGTMAGDSDSSTRRKGSLFYKRGYLVVTKVVQVLKGRHSNV
jgi:hypothetical protein